MGTTRQKGIHLKGLLGLLFLTALIGFHLLHSFAQEEAPAPPSVDTGDTAWMLASAALVLLMTPGLALFYGGMVRTRGDSSEASLGSD